MSRCSSHLCESNRFQIDALAIVDDEGWLGQVCLVVESGEPRLATPDQATILLQQVGNFDYLRMQEAQDDSALAGR